MGGRSTVDVDPRDIDYDIEHSDQNKTRGVTNHLARVADTNIWVHYTTYDTEDGTGYEIRQMGYLGIEPVDLSTDTVADRIREEADTLADSDRGVLAEPLRAQAEDLAVAVVGEYFDATVQIIEMAVRESKVGIEGDTVWATAKDPYTDEAENAVEEVGIEDTTGDVSDVVRRALSDGLSRVRRESDRAYIGELDLGPADEDDEWQLRAVELQQRSVLPPQTARVQALREHEYRQQEIAEQLDLDASTVSRHVRRADDYIDRAEWTVEHVG